VSDLRTESDAHHVAVFRDGDAHPLVVQNAPDGGRPYLHPIEAPAGAGSVTEDQPGHHPWQHGLYIGLNDVNGVGFWSEKLWPATADLDGTFSSRIVGVPRTEVGAAHWAVETDYLDPQGERMFRDLQRWTLRDHDTRLELRLEWTLTADRDLVFGRYDYGGLFLRMPYRDETGGSAVDSEGTNGPANRRAGWRCGCRYRRRGARRASRCWTIRATSSIRCPGASTTSSASVRRRASPDRGCSPPNGSAPSSTASSWVTPI